MTEKQTMTEKIKGTVKELAGKLTGSDELAKEGEAQQQKAQKQEEAQQAASQQRGYASNR